MSFHALNAAPIQKGRSLAPLVLGILAASTCSALTASEHLLGYVHGAEPLPKNAWELDVAVTNRFDKGQGTYNAYDAVVGVEYGATDRLTLGVDVKGQAVSTSGLIINGYLPQEKSDGLRPSGAEAEVKYNVLSTAKEGLGLTIEFGVDYGWLDPHSGQDKRHLSLEYGAALQSYFLDGQLVWVGNLGIETTYADRSGIEGLDPAIEWSTDPEIEAEFKVGSGISYRFAAGWFAGVEALYETEFETEVGQERWSLFGGPSIHYANQTLWLTLTWLPQIGGGGEKYDGQEPGLHLIEKTKQEIRLRCGYNF